MTGTGNEQERLDRLDEKVDEQRRNLADMTGLDEGAGREPRFIDDGDVEEDKVDNNIAPG